MIYNRNLVNLSLIYYKLGEATAIVDGTLSMRHPIKRNKIKILLRLSIGYAIINQAIKNQH